MGDFLNLPGVIPSGPVRETPDLIELPAALKFRDVPPCPVCTRPMTKNGVELVDVLDAPSRGKRVRIVLRKERRRCRTCKRQVTASSPGLRPGYHVLTKRLVRHVENRVLKTTLADVGREVGLTEDVVTTIALDLDARLQRDPGHFETPDAIAVDNIQTAPGSRFQVLYDQIAERPMALAPTWSFEPIRNEVLRLDVSRVRVFSSDMAKVNLDVAEVLTNAIHVADRFHVYQPIIAAVGTVINERIATLSEARLFGEAAALRAEKPSIIGSVRVEAADGLALAGAPEWRRYPDVVAAHAVLAQLARFYASSNWIAGRSALDDLYQRMDDRLIATAMKPALAYVRGHDRQVFSYHEALALIGRDLWSPTTNGLERRNGTIQAIWRSARAYRDPRLFRLRAIYHPYTLGLHLLDCDRCDGFVGPLDPGEVLAVSQGARRPALCRGCSATSDSAESSISSPECDVAM